MVISGLPDLVIQQKAIDAWSLYKYRVVIPESVYNVINVLVVIPLSQSE
jgi:hypothetical protein